MLDVGFSEILLTSAIALIVLGPERLPKVARQVGNWMGRARAMARQLSEQLEREVSAEEFLKAQNKPSAVQAAGSQSPQSSVSPVPAVSAVPDASAMPAAAGDHAAAPRMPEINQGLDAAATTPAAMHASDPIDDSKARDD
jgi:sec-independent protein translocase protein TatB